VLGMAEAVGRALPAVAAAAGWVVTAVVSGAFGLLVGAALIPFGEHVAVPAMNRLRGTGGNRAQGAS